MGCRKRSALFQTKSKSRHITRGGMLSTLGSFYDLLGLASSFVLKDRKILQDLSHEGLQWEERVSELYQTKWK